MQKITYRCAILVLARTTASLPQVSGILAILNYVLFTALAAGFLSWRLLEQFACLIMLAPVQMCIGKTSVKACVVSPRVRHIS